MRPAGCEVCVLHTAPWCVTSAYHSWQQWLAVTSLSPSWLLPIYCILPCAFYPPTRCLLLAMPVIASDCAKYCAGPLLSVLATHRFTCRMSTCCMSSIQLKMGFYLTLDASARRSRS